MKHAVGMLYNATIIEQDLLCLHYDCVSSIMIFMEKIIHGSAQNSGSLGLL